MSIYLFIKYEIFISKLMKNMEKLLENIYLSFNKLKSFFKSMI